MFSKVKNTCRQLSNAVKISASIICRSLLVLIVLGLLTLPAGAQSLLQQSNLTYQGAFRVPHGTFGGSTFDYGGSAMAFNPSGNGGAGSLFIVGHAQHQMTAEISIPSPVNSSNVASLNVATILQNFADPTEGKMGAINPPTVGSRSIGGQLAANGKLYVTGFVFYDGAGEATKSHFVRPLNLATTGQVTGPLQVTSPGSAGFVGGWINPIPSAFQASLGGPFFTGQCCLSVISRTSYGPAAFSFDIANLGVKDPVPSAPLVYYPGTHPTLGNWGDTSPYFNGTTQISGAIIPVNTRSMLFFGRHGTGPFCYGSGTANQALVGQPTGEGDFYCFDPADGSKGTHAYPYRNQVWAYDLNDLAAVKAGTKNPWDPIPYAVWGLSLPFSSGNVRSGAVAYDSFNQIIYMVQPFVDSDPGAPWPTYPVVLVWRIQAATPPPPTPPLAPSNLSVK